MSITISDVLKLKSFERAKLVAGAGGLTNKVEQVSVIETPDASLWFKGGELFISAFYSVKNDPKAQLDTIRAMKQVGSAGLVICYRERYVKEIDAAVIDFANANDVPIIELPGIEVVYFELINEIMNEVVQRKTMQLEYAREVHFRMIRLILEGKGYLEIGNNLEEIIKNPLLAVDKDFHILYKTASFSREFIDLLRDSFDFSFSHDSAFQNVEDNWKRIILPGCPAPLVVVPIIIGRKTTGKLIIIEQAEELDEWKLIALQEVSLVIALEQAKQLAVAEVERRHRKGFIDELLAGHITSENGALDKGYFFGLELSRFSVLILVELDNTEQSGQVYQQSRKFTDSKLKQESGLLIVDHLVKAIEHVVRKKSEKTLVLDKTNGAIILPYFLGTKNSREVLRQARQMAKEILEYTKEKLPGSTISIGISDYFGNVDEMARAYREAREAIQIIRCIGKNDRIGCFVELEGYSVLKQLVQNGNLQSYYERVYGPLLEYDRKNGTDLTYTAEVYFTSGGNSVEAAKRLFIHRNSIKYRKTKIKEILGYDPFEGVNYTKFFIATLAKQLLATSSDKNSS